MRITLQKSKLETNILFLLLYIGILIDNVVGYYMRTTGDESVLSKIYRLFIIVYLLMIIFVNNMKRSSSYIILLLYGLLLPILQGVNNITFEGVFINILNVIKILFPLLIFASGTALYKKGKIGIKDIDDYLNNISWIYPFSIIIPYILGTGFKAYSGTTGYSGFYSSANELSIILCIVFIFHMNKFYKKNNIKSVFGVFISAISIILTGTKAGIIIMVLTGGYYLVKKDKNILKKIIYCFCILFAIIIISIFVSSFLGNELIANIERLQYKFQQLDGNIINFLFSNRNIKILPNFILMLESPIQIFIGAGYYQKVIVMDEYIHLASDGLVEMDFFDIMFQYGVMMALIIWGFYLRILIGYKNIVMNHYIFGLFCILLYSFMAGHVMFAPSVGSILALLCLGIVFVSHKNKAEFEVGK